MGGTSRLGHPARGARVGQLRHCPHRGSDASMGAAVARALRPRSIERANRYPALRTPRPLFPPKNVMMSCPWRVASAPSCGGRARTGRWGHFMRQPPAEGSWRPRYSADGLSTRCRILSEGEDKVNPHLPRKGGTPGPPAGGRTVAAGLLTNDWRILAVQGVAAATRSTLGLCRRRPPICRPTSSPLRVKSKSTETTGRAVCVLPRVRKNHCM